MRDMAQLLDYRELTRHYQERSTYNDLWVTRTFWDGATREQTFTDQVEMVVLPTSNVPGRGNTRNGPANIIQPLGASAKFHAIFRRFDQMPLHADALRALRELDSQSMQSKGRQIVEQNINHFGRQAALFKELIFAQILTVGRVNMDRNFNIVLPTVSATTGVITDHADTMVSADFSVPDNHRGNLGGGVAEDVLISALWSSADTVISTQIDAIRDRAAREGSVPPTTIYLNHNDRKYLRANTEFKEWAKYHSVRVDDLLSGRDSAIDGLWGMRWVFLEPQYYQLAEGGDQLPIIPDGCVLMTSDPTGDWLRRYEGTEMLSINPTTMFGTLEEAVASIIEHRGPFAYAMVDRSSGVATLSAFSGDNFGMAFAKPNIWIPKVFATA